MTSRTKRTLAGAIVVLLVVSAFLVISGAVIPAVHTNGAFAQMDAAYKKQVKTSGAFAHTPREFVTFAAGWEIDWNGCGVRSGELHDAWDQRVEISVDKRHVVTLISAGRDRQFGTEDDIRFLCKPSDG